jgi:hypothetical protein
MRGVENAVCMGKTNICKIRVGKSSEIRSLHIDERIE